MPIYIPAAPATNGLLLWEWVDPGGVVRDLTQATSPGVFVTRGAGGLGAPTSEPVLEKLPTSAGSAVRHIRRGPLEIALPIAVIQSSFALALAVVDDLRGWFDTGGEESRTPGYLRITRPQDDAVRQVACFYTGGLDGDLSEGAPQYAPLVVSLVAPDPTWTATEEDEETYDQDDLGDTLAVINDGDYAAYPIWTIGGPVTAITLNNTTTGKTLALTSLGMLSTDTLTIDTRPSSQRETLPVIDQDGLSFYSRLTVNSALWWLQPGQNNFTITATGATADTSIGLRWLSRYRGVLR